MSLQAAFLATDEAKAVVAADLAQKALMYDKVVLCVVGVTCASSTAEDVDAFQARWGATVLACKSARAAAEKTQAFKDWFKAEQAGKPIYRDGGYIRRQDMMRRCFGNVVTNWRV